MSRKILLISAVSALLLTSACSKESANSSTTRLDAVEVESGSISDAMITLDQAASDGTAIDNSVPVDTSAQAETPPATSADTAADSSTAEDVVIAPPAAGSALPVPAPVTK